MIEVNYLAAGFYLEEAEYVINHDTQDVTYERMDDIFDYYCLN